MATKTLQFDFFPSQSLTCNVYANSGGAALNTSGVISLSDTSSPAGYYTGPFIDPATGVGLRVQVFNSGDFIGTWGVDINSDVAGLYELQQIATAGQIGVQVGSNVEVQSFLTVPGSVAQALQIPYQIACVRGDTFQQALPLLGTLSGWQKIYFTVKSKATDPDSASVVQIVLLASGPGSGLLIVNGDVAPTPSYGSITIANPTTGLVTVTIDQNVTETFTIKDWYWDCQIEFSTSIKTPVIGRFQTVMDITQTIN